MKLPYIAVFKIIMEGKSASRFLLGAVASFAFSIAVILCTIGLMDGFENTLKSGLNKSAGDLELYQGESFFYLASDIQQLLNQHSELHYTPLIQAEGFILGKKESKGVLIKGISSESFSKVTGLNARVNKGEILLGKELYDFLQIQSGDNIVLTFATNSQRNQGAPVLKEFKVVGTLAHGIYEKDLRFVYIHQDDLRMVLGLKKDVYNSVSLKLKGSPSTTEIIDKASELERQLNDYRVVPFWQDFQTLLNAVEVEKFSISLVLQLIVIVAIFNVIAFIIFISEKKSQEFFLLRALGLNLNSLVKFWAVTVFGIWATSCLLSIAFARFFNFLLLNLPLFQLPGDIYVLSNLTLKLGIEDYFLVFGLALVWMMLITLFALLRLKKKSLIYGLRQEFA